MDRDAVAPVTPASEQLEALREVLRAISDSPFDLDGVLAIVVERLIRLCRAQYGMVFLPSDPGFYRGVVAYGMDPAMAEHERTHPTPIHPGTLVGRVVLSGAMVHMEDASTDPSYTDHESLRVGHFKTLLGVPIRTASRLIGVIAAARTEKLPYTTEEIDLVRAFADQAAVVLENVRLLTTIERQREQISEFLPATVADLIGTAEGEQLLAGHRREVSAVYCDLRGFTAFAEASEPEEVLDTLRQYHREMGEIVMSHKAMLQDFAGDGMMIVLNDPETVPEHAFEAVRMALEMRTRFGEMSAGWRRNGIELGLGVGIALGFATLGRIGFKGHYGYSLIGSVANLASRLCAIAPDGHVYASARTFARVEDRFDAVPLGPVELKGFHRPIEAFDISAAKP